MKGSVSKVINTADYLLKNPDLGRLAGLMWLSFSLASSVAAYLFYIECERKLIIAKMGG